MPKNPSKKAAAPPAALAWLKDPKVQKVKVAVADIDGVLRGKIMHKDKFLSAIDKGFGFCNVVFGWDSSDACYDNSAYTGWHSGYPDATVRIDLGTARRVPWDGQIPFFLGDFEDKQGRPLAQDPRQLLKKVLAQASRAGYQASVGMEFEWFNFKETPQSLAAKDHQRPEPITPGMFGYSLLRAGLNRPYFNALMDELPAFGVPLEGLHTETGPGVFEAAILYCGALEAADRAVLFKTAAKEIAYRFGILPSFMAKWSSQLPGCSGHCHQSLWDKAGKANLFHDPRDPDQMSALFKSYLAGQLHCLPEILPMFAPTVNSYKRLVDGYWAPTKPVWGMDNRTAACRVIGGGPKSTRVETRVPGSDVNPYLCVAACVAAGLYGVAKNLQLTEPVVGSAYASKVPRLPRTLHAATEAMESSKLARELFGADFVEHFVQTRRWEWRQFEDAVTDWELKRYFEII
ncbi:MAG TPA: glutamine synthetase family protein [bacterium]|jgi:glutamine synthetase|nr:glutamine synthetase family protein [bacterium]